MDVQSGADYAMTIIYPAFEATVSAITLFVALLISYRAYRGHRITGNLNLLLLGAGFTLIALGFVLDIIGAIAQHQYTTRPGAEFLFNYIRTMIEVAAYLLIMLAYLARPKVEDLLPALGVILLPFTFQIFIAILLAVIVLSVWMSYSKRPTASTALVLSSFSLLFILHLVNAILIFTPRAEAAGYLYYSIFQLFAFGLLYMAIGQKHHSREQQERKNIA